MNELDFIKTVKIQGQGYLLNGTLCVPKVYGNSEYELIKLWLAEGNKPEAEFSAEELAQVSLNKAIQEAQSLLDSTQFKFGEDYDKKYTSEWLELKEKRQEAREFIRLHSS